MALHRDLGSLQEKVLDYLAENPNQHKQSIQKAIPSKQYGSILHAVNALEKAGYVESEDTLSEKNVPMKLYSCTDKGIQYALTKASEDSVLKILDAYKKKFSVNEFFLSEYKRLGHDRFFLFFKIMMKSLPILEKKDKDEAAQQMLFLAMKTQENLSPKEQKQMLKEITDQFPEAKKSAKEAKKRLDELFGDI